MISSDSPNAEPQSAPQDTAAQNTAAQNTAPQNTAAQNTGDSFEQLLSQLEDLPEEEVAAMLARNDHPETHQ
jgi:hypothetical protein